MPSHDPDWGDLGEASPARSAPGHDAILRPPKPQIPPRPRCSSSPPNTTPSLKRLTDRCHWPIVAITQDETINTDLLGFIQS